MTIADKLAFWHTILNDLKGLVSQEFIAQLRESSHIDRIDGNRVVIAVLPEPLIAQCEAVYCPEIENALTVALERSVNAVFIHDRKGLWGRVLDECSDAIDMGFCFSLRDKAFIERIESHKVVIAVSSQAIQQQCEKKYRFKIANAFSAELGKKVDVVFAQAAPRIYVDLPDQDRPAEHRLKKLHDDHGDIMSIVDNDPLFKKASAPIEAGGWGINPKKLTNDCKDYGVIRIQDGLAKMARKGNLKKPAVAFQNALKRRDFGDKLERGANILGLRHDGKICDGD